MHRVRGPLFLSLVAAVMLVTLSCGVAANTTAAVVGDQTVSTDSVDQITRDAVFVRAVLSDVPPPEDQSVIPGELARTSLLFEIQRTALLAELDRWGLELTEEDRSAARANIEQQLPEPLESENMERLVDYVAATVVLEQRFAALDAESESDLRMLYDGAPSLWDRVCLAAVQVASDQSAETQAAIDDGAGIEALGDEVEGAQVVADPAQGCTSRTQLPEELRSDVEDAEIGEVRGPVVVPGPQGDIAFFYRVDSTERLGFSDAAQDLTGLVEALAQRAAQQQAAGLWVGLMLQDQVEINPRYGSGVTVGAQGQLVIEAPDAPPAPVGIPLPPQAQPPPAGP